jgi:hypothetical protein
MASRYAGKQILTNSEEQYKEYMRERGVKFIRQYASPEIRFPTYEELRTLETVGHIWKTGDRFYKLADKYYGDVELWWLIPWFNQILSESSLSLGDIVEIPLPLSAVLRIARF